jgi:hypothetical protein
MLVGLMNAVSHRHRETASAGCVCHATHRWSSIFSAPRPRGARLTEVPVALVVWVWLGLAILPAICMAADDTPTPPVTSWSVGWDGEAMVGRWSSGRFTGTVPSAGRYRLDWSTEDAEGQTVVYQGRPQVVTSGLVTLTTAFQLSRLEAPLVGRVWQVPDDSDAGAQVAGANGNSNADAAVGAAASKSGSPILITEQKLTPPSTGRLRPQWLRLNDRLFAVVGGKAGFEEQSTMASGPRDARSVVRVSLLPNATALPTDAEAYLGLSTLVLAGTVDVSAEVSATLEAWVRRGGRIVISLPQDATRWSTSPLSGWVPVLVDPNPVSVRELGPLEAFAGRNVRIPLPGGQRQPSPVLQPIGGEVLATSRETPLLVRVPHGLGEVLVLGLDVTKAPLVNWRALPDFARRLMQLPDVATSGPAVSNAPAGAQLSSTGISDLASQHLACHDTFPMVQRPSPWWAMSALLLTLLAVGAVDYVLVHRVLRRPTWTWVTLPAWLLLAAITPAVLATGWNGRQLLINQTDLIDLDASTGTVRGRSWTTLYSPQTQQATWTFPALPSVINQPSETGVVRTAPFAPPEDVFGGLYRSGGTAFGRTTYQLTAESSGSQSRHELPQLPVLRWSTRTMTRDWTDRAAQPVADTALRSSGLGRLSGLVTHHLSGPLEDWVLVYGSRLYRWQPSRNEEVSRPWPPGVPLDIEAPEMFQRELRGVLTQAVVVRVKSTGSTAGDSVRENQSRYDPLHRNPDRLWQLLTFFSSINGTGYTGLANDMLADEDLSRQLSLGRAVVFGKLSTADDQPVTINGQPISRARHDRYVRLVLPVKRTGEIELELPKYDANKPSTPATDSKD